MSPILSFACLLCFLLYSLEVHGQTANPNTTCRRICSIVESWIQANLLIVETISSFPALIEVTLEELETGLENGHFTSVDLVNVRWPCSFNEIGQMTNYRRTLPESMRSTALFIVSPRSIRMQSV